MAETLEADICVIGAGAGGLVVAAGASQFGAPTVLVERGPMGGDCLNYGCVPSKSLIAAARLARAAAEGRRFGLAAMAPEPDLARVMDHVRGVIAAIAPMDSVARFEGLGVRVLRGEARFAGPDLVVLGDGTAVRARRIVVATGSRPGVPSIPGLPETPFLTNETIWTLDRMPRRLIVIGGGPIGIELAQAFRHLGADVTILEMFRLLARSDGELVDILRHRLVGDGIDLHEGVGVRRVEATADGVAVMFARDGGPEERVDGSHLLVAAGRQANVEDLDLDRAGIRWSPRGIEVDAGLRTSNRRVYAIGDCAGGPQFTHVAGYHASLVLRSALFRLPARADHDRVPRVTYAAPEVAEVGLGEAEAERRHGAIRVLRWSFHENDRAQTARATDGLVNAVTTPRGRILGAGIVGEHAGELIQLWTLAIAQKLKIGALAGMVAPYPTLGETAKRAAGSFYLPGLFGPRVKSLVRFLRRFG
jgi:pyruvate/2-oxoglutarate dehydrogenase complex dihydrolipoamide dehydrogenase (E3) component